MHKEVFDLLDQIKAKKIEMDDLINADRLDDAEKVEDEIKALNSEMEALKNKKSEEENKVDIKDMTQVVTNEPKDAVKEFAAAARRGFAMNYNNETTGADGGYTVPQDIQTKINEFKEAKFSLEKLVSVEKVTTLSGRRTYKTRAQHTGFVAVGESEKISRKDGPQFEVINYEVKKYAGYMPVTNELLADSDANITSVLTKWLAEEDVATRNTIILNTLNSVAVTDLKDLKGIKKAINVTLGAAFAEHITIVTNDDGLNYLDTLTDANGRFLLQPTINPDAPLSMTMAVGAHRIPVTVVPNDVLATTGNAVPFIIGDLKEAIKLFDRASISITTSNTASVTGFNAFEQDMTLFRGIERFDCKIMDSKAVVNGTITVA